jgi:hypothetical protein
MAELPRYRPNHDEYRLITLRRNYKPHKCMSLVSSFPLLNKSRFLLLLLRHCLLRPFAALYLISLSIDSPATTACTYKDSRSKEKLDGNANTLRFELRATQNITTHLERYLRSRHKSCSTQIPSNQSGTMASHVVVIDTSFRRVTIKVTPGKYLTDVLEEACTKFSLKSSNYGLK